MAFCPIQQTDGACCSLHNGHDGPHVYSYRAVDCYDLPSQSSVIDHPPHYGGADDGYEVIKVIEAWSLGFHLGNVVKYIGRASKKGSALEDLKKAQWYLDREISNRESAK